MLDSSSHYLLDLLSLSSFDQLVEVVSDCLGWDLAGLFTSRG